MWDQITGPADPSRVEAVVALALAAARTRPAGAAGPVVVAVDGRSGAGKTTLAHHVATALAGLGTVAVVHMDRIYPGWDGLAESSEILATHVLAPLAEGNPAAYGTWDWQEERWGEPVTVEPTDFLVVEGCGSSVGPARPYAAVTVFVDADRALRRARGLARDGDAYRPHWERWAAQEEGVFRADRTRERADLVIDTTRGPTTV